jgi:hypothetical protein
MTPPSAHRKPYQQGQFDGLCGIYAILNSIKWLYRLDEAAIEAMFRHLCDALPPGTFPKALWEGLGVPELRSLLNTSAAHLAKKHGYADFCWRLPFLRRTFPSAGAFWRGIEEELSGPVPAVMIVGLNKPWDHWTVAHKVTPRAVEFFDSSGMRRYPFTSFTLDKTKAGEELGQKILIDVHQAFRLYRSD